MYIQKFCPEGFLFRQFTDFRKIIFLCASLLFTANAWTLSTDKDQPVEIEANAAELDDEKGVTIYYGNVVLTQGSVRMTGDTMTVYFKEDELDTLIMEGKPARYRQLPDGKKVYDEAEALRMEYYERKSLVILLEKASFKQEGLSFSGNKIEYDTERSKIKIKGDIKQQTKTSGASSEATGNSRVKIILKPKKKKE